MPDDHRQRVENALTAQMAAHRQQLCERDPALVAANSGAAWDAASGTLTFDCLSQPLIVATVDYGITAQGDRPLPVIIQALATTYLLTADGTPRAGQWIAFRDLPDGTFYHQAFTGYTGQRLVRMLGDAVDRFRHGAEAAGGASLSGLGDAAFEFRVLPRLWLAAIYWQGDAEDDFPPQARVLFDGAASRYMILDGLAILGSMLTGRILKFCRD